MSQKSRRSGIPAKDSARSDFQRVLVVDDSEGIRVFLTHLLGIRGYEVEAVEDGIKALEVIDRGGIPDLILLDIMMPGMNGMEVLANIRARNTQVPIVMISVVGRTPTIVESMRLGATDFLNKPFEEEDLDRTLRSCLDCSFPAQARSLMLDVEDRSKEEVWESDAMSEIRGVIEHISDTDVTVLIQGESGVGKEIVSRGIHEHSTRRNDPFVKVNCAALPEDLLESELFGYEKGAFTGAFSRKLGKFEVASGGTIFLDEIGEMSPGLQAKLLQVLQDSCFTRLGGNKEVTVDVRVVCATHRPLSVMVAQNDFREDLYFRLNVVNIHIPPLRERREEIPLLVDRFISRYSSQYARPIPHISDRMLTAFDKHPFPGNIRELENMVKRIVVLENEETILQELSQKPTGNALSSRLQVLFDDLESRAGSLPLREVGRLVSEEVEREAIKQVLHHTDWNRKRAAKLLGISYKTLLHKIRSCGLMMEL